MATLREYIYSILRHWKWVLIITLCAGVIGSVIYRLQCTDDEDASKTTNVETEWRSAEEVYSGSLKYVGIGNEIVSGSTIRDAYLAKLNGTEITQKIEKKIGNSRPDGYIDALIKISTSDLDTYLGINVVDYDESECKTILNEIKSYLTEKNTEMSIGLGEHSLFLVDSFVTKMPKSSLDETTVEKLDKVYSDENAMSETVGGIFSKKICMVYFGLSAMLGGVLSGIYIIIRDYFKKIILGSSLVCGKLQIECVGDFSIYKEKGKADKIIKNLLYGKKYFSILGTAKMAIFQIEEKWQLKNCYLVGDVLNEEVKKNIQLLIEVADNKNLLIAREWIDSDGEKLKGWDEKKPVIIMIRKYNDSFDKVEMQVKMMRNLGMKVLGGILV